jgi:hypothetical protein
MPYTQLRDVPLLNSIELAEDLRGALAAGLRRLNASFDAQSSAGNSAPGKWSAKEVIGHLIDSALNNHQRVVRLNIDTRVDLPGYQQNEWVRVQGYADRSWFDLLKLWEVVNLHLAEAIQRTPKHSLEHTWFYDGERVPLGHIIEDYTAHMNHHLRALCGG